MHEDNTDLCSLCARSEAAVRDHVNSSFAPHTECTQTWGGSRHISTLLLRCSGSVTSHEHTETNVCTVSIPLQLKASSFPLTLQIPFFSHFLLQSDMRVFRASGVHATALRIKKWIHKKNRKYIQVGAGGLDVTDWLKLWEERNLHEAGGGVLQLQRCRACSLKRWFVLPWG